MQEGNHYTNKQQRQLSRLGKKCFSANWSNAARAVPGKKKQACSIQSSGIQLSTKFREEALPSQSRVLQAVWPDRQKAMTGCAEQSDKDYSFLYRKTSLGIWVNQKYVHVLFLKDVAVSLPRIPGAQQVFIGGCECLTQSLFSKLTSGEKWPSQRATNMCVVLGHRIQHCIDNRDAICVESQSSRIILPCLFSHVA